VKLPVVSCAEMRQIEEATFEAGISAEKLMGKVGQLVAQAVAQLAPGRGDVHVYYGKGHNGGDALVAARWLLLAGFHVRLVPQEKDTSKLAALTRDKLTEFAGQKVSFSAKGDWLPRPLVILDGLLGIGASGKLRDDVRQLTRKINEERLCRNALVVAVDVPTGLDGDTGEADPDCVIADVTVTAGFAKKGLVADGAANFVGRLAVAALEEFAPRAPSKFEAEVATPESLAGLVPRRMFDSHKTLNGRVGIVAGSLGFTGAAVMCASGALRAGAGLITLYASEDIQPALAITVPPEVMVRPVASYSEVLEQKHDVLAVGPGLGKAHSGAILNLIEHAACPIVLDADGLNLVASHEPGLLSRCAGPRLLTPHPGEMARLFPDSAKLSRHETVTRFTKQFSGSRSAITLLLKGSRTIIHELGKPVSYNTTGTPAMGTGGMGDVLTGVCAALIGQGLSGYDAARTGTWLCARAAEIAQESSEEHSLAAMDVVSSLGAAFAQLQGGGL
jgi:ADP-dependent NAD(P)H-hydrate dehydratase / NAD(P)H-hydrate epimerase